MESSNSNNEEDDRFSDAFEDFPFYDCLTPDYQLEPSASCSAEILALKTNLRRRRSSADTRMSGNEIINPSLSSSTIESVAPGIDEQKQTLAEEMAELDGDSRGNATDSDVIESVGEEKEDSEMIESSPAQVGKDPVRDGSSTDGEKKDESTVTMASDSRVGDSVDSAPRHREPSSTDWSVLEFLAGLVIKAMIFQLNLLISFIAFPPWALYGCYAFVLDPFGITRRSKGYIMSKFINLWDLVARIFSPFISDWLKDNKSMLKVFFGFGWGLFWAVYVGFVLLALLVSSLMLGGITTRYLVEKPIVIKESLSFDYTKNSPEAYVPIVSCAGLADDSSYKNTVENVKMLRSRVIPANHNLQVVVSLTLPDSEYNRNLGMFQVRVDFLSPDGQILSSSRHPSMLKFRSEPIRLIQTFLKIAPLITGYVSETQTLNLKYKGLMERDVPTACLKVMIEQRAEFRPGAGVPELYGAYLVLESRLPFLKRVIWYWRNTLFVWISMNLFIIELFFGLFCCRPLIIPRTRGGQTISSRNASNRNVRSGRR